MIPSADVLYACDPHWWEHHHQKIIEGTSAELWTQDAAAERKWGLNRIEGVWLEGLGRDRLHFGGNSGYQAVNLAFLFGAARIILLGFDMQRTDGKVHFFGIHPYHRSLSDGPTDSLLADWAKKFERLALDLAEEGVEVINASRATALTCFERKELEQC